MGEEYTYFHNHFLVTNSLSNPLFVRDFRHCCHSSWCQCLTIHIHPPSLKETNKNTCVGPKKIIDHSSFKDNAVSNDPTHAISPRVAVPFFHRSLGGCWGLRPGPSQTNSPEKVSGSAVMGHFGLDFTRKIITMKKGRCNKTCLTFSFLSEYNPRIFD